MRTKQFDKRYQRFHNTMRLRLFTTLDHRYIIKFISVNVLLIRQEVRKQRILHTVTNSPKKRKTKRLHKTFYHKQFKLKTLDLISMT